MGSWQRCPCLDIVSFLTDSLRKPGGWREQLFVDSTDAAAAFDSVEADVIGKTWLGKGAHRVSPRRQS